MVELVELVGTGQQACETENEITTVEIGEKQANIIEDRAASKNGGPKLP